MSKIKQLAFFTMLILSTIWITSCAKEITLNLSYGDRTGKYTGEMTEDGVPNGYGKFTSENVDGDKWTYEGQFQDGHFEGDGIMTWETGTVDIGTYHNDVIVPLEGDAIKTLFTEPGEFNNHFIKTTGKVFAGPDYTDEGAIIQIWTDIDNLDKELTVVILDPGFEIDKQNYISIVGKIVDPSTIAINNTYALYPIVAATEYEILTDTQALAPTKEEISVDQTVTQSEYSITIQKIERADEETRVFVKAINNGSNTLFLSGLSAKIIQNEKQYDAQMDLTLELETLPSELIAGGSAEGVLKFPGISEDAFDIIIPAYSVDPEEDINDFSFHIE